MFYLHKKYKKFLKSSFSYKVKKKLIVKKIFINKDNFPLYLCKTYTPLYLCKTYTYTPFYRRS